MSGMNEIIGRGANNSMIAVEESASIAEIQAKMILARHFPRDIDGSLAYITKECENKELAEKAVYEFKRGDSVVRGASIRLVECVARHWGNLLSGIKEIESNDKKATVKAFCWDLETNFADEKIFDVAYIRETKSAGKIPVTGERDKYEIMANMAARRKRACIQAVIPQFVIDKAISVCEQTLEGAIDNVNERRDNMLAAFAKKADWITKEVIEEKIGKPFDTISKRDLVKLISLYNAINDGFVKPEDAFGKVNKNDIQDEAAADSLRKLNDLIGERRNEANK